MEHPDTMTPAAQTPSGSSGEGATNLSGGASRNSVNQGGHSRYNYRNRGGKSMITVNQAEKDFKG